jgi:hypothetical protein
MSGSTVAVLGWYRRCLKADLIKALCEDIRMFRRAESNSKRDIGVKISMEVSYHSP